MPWDSDLDVQVSETTMYFLAEYYNMTSYRFDIPGVPEGRDFLLEINPNFVTRTFDDNLNKIDGRWIDKDSGLFIDITCVRKDYEDRSKGKKGALFSKDRHHYQVRIVCAVNLLNIGCSQDAGGSDFSITRQLL